MMMSAVSKVKHHPVSFGFDTAILRRDNFIAMWASRLALILVVAFVCVVGMGLLPRGTAPFSVVYGPASAFRAERAFLLLTFAVLTALKLSAGSVPTWFLASFFSYPVFAPFAPVSDLALLTCNLRC